MSGKVLSAKRTGRKNHKALVDAADSRDAKLEKRFMKPQLLSPESYYFEQSRSNTTLPTSALMTGHWVRPDPRDTDMEIRKKLIEEGGGGGGSTAYGVLADSGETIEWLKDKKKQEQYIQELRLAALQIDPKAPETQEAVFTDFPELKNYPEEYHAENLALQEALRTIIRDGKINGKEDNALMLKILQQDFKLPIWPVWDPEGLLIKSVLNSSDFLSSVTEYYKRGLFNPRKYGVDISKAEDKWQTDIKKMLLRRCYRGVRDWTDTELDTFYNFIKQKSSGITSNASKGEIYRTGDNPLNFLQYLRNPTATTAIDASKLW